MIQQSLRITLLCALFIGFYLPLLRSQEFQEGKIIAKRVYANLLIKDYSTALDEVQNGLRSYPQSEQLHEARIKVFAKQGDERKMLDAWHEYAAQFPKENVDRDIVEAMAWGVIEKGSDSTSPMTRLIAILAAFFSQDSKGVQILRDNLHNSNSLIRLVTVQLSGHLMDDILREEVLGLLKTENQWNVRLEVIKALGVMKMEESKPELEMIIANDKSMAEEKAAAIAALVSMMETADRNYVYSLTQSDRSGLRMLACEVVSTLDLERDIDLIIPLLDDHNAEVRAEALTTIGVLRTSSFQGKPIAEIVAPKTDDIDSSVAITAAWVLMLNDPQRGQETIKRWFEDDCKDVRLNAAAALSAAGKYGQPLTLQIFRNSKDIYVRLNLALALIAQRINTQQACDTLYEGLCTEKERWMWQEDGPFCVLAPSKLKHQQLIPQYPEAINLTVRLKILDVLAVMRYGRAQQAIKSFLKERSENISSVAAALLLTEGDEEAIEIVKELLKDPNPKIRIQAALILSMWSHEDSSLEILEKAYANASREQKERILEGLGHIGSIKSIPFLIEKLKEPYQILRLIAASGLIQCLNH